jgi:hypothetical protein
VILIFYFFYFITGTPAAARFSTGHSGWQPPWELNFLCQLLWFLLPHFRQQYSSRIHPTLHILLTVFHPHQWKLGNCWQLPSGQLAPMESSARNSAGYVPGLMAVLRIYAALAWASYILRYGMFHKGAVEGNGSQSSPSHTCAVNRTAIIVNVVIIEVPGGLFTLPSIHVETHSGYWMINYLRISRFGTITIYEKNTVVQYPYPSKS